MTNTTRYYSAPGKFLITGEYLILEGAEGLALPLKAGQSLKIELIDDKGSQLVWTAVSPEGEWFSGTFRLPSFDFETVTDESFAERLVEILKTVRYLNPGFLLSGSYQVKTVLDFNPEFGFGSSSTLIANLARWADVDAFELQRLTFKGSGYDIAVALEGKPIVFKLRQTKPVYHSVKFNAPFSNNIYFVYLGKKRRSLEAVKQFKETAVFSRADIDTVTTITREIINSGSLQQFEKLLKEHELLMSKILKTPTIGRQLFNSYTGGVVKSLGAWGGDFVLVTSQQKPEEFKQEMNQRGFKTIYCFDELVMTK